MTEYERLVKEGLMEPMNGLDSLTIGAIVDWIVDGSQIMDEDTLEAIEGVMVEIDYIFKDEQEKLDKLKTIITEYKKIQ